MQWLREALEKPKLRVCSDYDMLVKLTQGHSSQDLKEMKQRLDQQEKQIEALQYENEGLHSKLSSSDAVPLLYMGEEKDFYQGEIRDLILSVLSDSIHQLQDKSRRQDVVKDIVENNEYQK